MDESNLTSQSEKEEITVEYANNVAIEMTVWDIKTIFGEYWDRSKSVEWHTSITMPWATAKLLVYYLQLNIALYEIYNGKVRIPESAIPAPPAPLPSGDESDPRVKAISDILQEHWKRFTESLNETPNPTGQS